MEAGVAAEPDTATAVEPPLALCEIVTTADLLPALCGWNATWSWQLAPTAIVPTLQVLPVPRRKSDALAPPIATFVICSGALPLFVMVVLSPDDITPTVVIGKATVLFCTEQIGEAVNTLVPDSPTEVGEPAALLVMVSEPLRVPAAVGANVALMVHVAPGLIVPTHVVVEENSGLGAADTCVIVSAPDPLLVSVTVCAALVVPTVCVENATDVRFSEIDGTGTALPMPDSAIAGLLAALDATVSVAVRVPVADGEKVALKVQLAPGATLTDAPTHVPVAVKSLAFVPLLLIAVIVRLPAPVFVSVTLAGTGAVLLVATWVEPNASDVAEAETIGAVAAAGLAM